MIDLTEAGPGFLGFVFTFGIALASVFLFRSMTKHLRNAKSKGDEPEPPVVGDVASAPSGPSAQ